MQIHFFGVMIFIIKHHCKTVYILGYIWIQTDVNDLQYEFPAKLIGYGELENQFSSLCMSSWLGTDVRVNISNLLFANYRNCGLAISEQLEECEIRLITWSFENNALLIWFVCCRIQTHAVPHEQDSLAPNMALLGLRQRGRVHRPESQTHHPGPNCAVL